jgi:hypothetical protein
MKLPKIKPVKAWAVAQINKKGNYEFWTFDVCETRKDAMSYKGTCYELEHQAIIIPVLITPITPRKGKK